MTTLYINHQFLDESEPHVSARDRGFLLGDGLFETLRAYKGQPLFLSQHWERLVESAQLLEISPPVSYKELENAIQELLKQNGLELGEARIRITLSRGVGKSGLSYSEANAPTLVITAEKYYPPAPLKKLVYASILRNELSPLSHIKSLNYLENILALNQAKQKNADDAVLLNTLGHIACATAANIFIISHNTLITPKINEGALLGIMRNIIIQLAQDLKVPCLEQAVTQEDIKKAEALFLTNSLTGIRPAYQLEEQTFLVDHKIIQELNKKLQNLTGIA